MALTRSFQSLLPVVLTFAGPTLAATTLAFAQNGAIEGRLVAPAPVVRRVADRYLADGGSAARSVQRIPAVAYLESPAMSDAAAATAGRRVRIVQRDTTFVPAVVIVAPGTVVEFPNEDPFFHNVFSYSALKRFDLGRYPRGESKSVRFDETGIARVYCEVHEFMRAAVIVTPSRFHTAIAPDGAFVIRDVAPGRYTLVVWHPDRVERVAVSVEAGTTTRVTVPSRGGSRPSR